MAVEHELPYCGLAQVDFETAPKQPASSTVTMHMDATVSVTERTVSIILHSLGIHSEPLHMEKERHAGPCPTLVVAKFKPMSGTTGHPRCSKWSASGSKGVASNKTASRSVGPDQGVEVPHTPRAKGCAAGANTKGPQSNWSTNDEITWAIDHDDVSARYIESLNTWKAPVALKKHPTVPSSTLRVRKWREFPYSDELATGFVNPDAAYVMTWRLKGNGEKISFELTLSGRVGIIMYDPKLCGGKYLYQSKSMHSKPELWTPPDNL